MKRNRCIRRNWNQHTVNLKNMPMGGGLTSWFDVSFLVCEPSSYPVMQKRAACWFALFKLNAQITRNTTQYSNTPQSKNGLLCEPSPHCCEVSDKVCTHMILSDSSWNRGLCWCRWSPGPADVTVPFCHGYSQRQMPPHRCPSSLQHDAGNPSLQNDGLIHVVRPKFKYPVKTGLQMDSSYLSMRKNNNFKKIRQIATMLEIKDNIHSVNSSKCEVAQSVCRYKVLHFSKKLK